MEKKTHIIGYWWPTKQFLDECEKWEDPFYKEAVEKGIHPVDLQDFSQSQDELKKIADYLDSGIRESEAAGYSFCRFGCGEPSHKMGNASLGDGIYSWPEGLSHYVKKHSIRLPEFFIEHIKKNSYKLEYKEHEEDTIGVSSFERWYMWCQEQRKTEFNDINWSEIDEA